MKKWGGGGGGGGGISRERLTAFVPTSDCRFNCHGMIYVPVSEGKLIVTKLLAPLFLSPAGGAIAPPAPPGHHATGYYVSSIYNEHWYLITIPFRVLVQQSSFLNNRKNLRIV